MRVLLLALMIALLPLRGWVGDVMAMELAHQPQPAAHHSADHGARAPCHEGQAALAHPHGPAPLVAAAQGASHDHGQATGEHGHCTACEICHSVALTAMLPQLPAAVLPAAIPASGQPLYASAERALGDKPPIS